MAKNKYNYSAYGFEEFFKQMEKTQNNIVGVAKEMCEVPAYTITKELRNLMTKHEETGDTAKAIIDPTGQAEFTGTKVIARFGFDLDKPNNAIIFMEKGAPGRKKINIVGTAIKLHYKTCLKQQEAVAKYWFDKPYDPNYWKQNRKE